MMDAKGKGWMNTIVSCLMDDSPLLDRSFGIGIGPPPAEGVFVLPTRPARDPRFGWYDVQYIRRVSTRIHSTSVPLSNDQLRYQKSNKFQG